MNIFLKIILIFLILTVINYVIYRFQIIFFILKIITLYLLFKNIYKIRDTILFIPFSRTRQITKPAVD